MPIRRELRPLYPPHWRELSSRVRFERAGGRCQRCGRPHLVLLRCLPDGRWFDEQAATWRDRRGRLARWPDLVEATQFRMTRVVLAAAHLDSDPTNNRLKNLRALCQRCHMLHDRPHHLVQRWITYRRSGIRRSLPWSISGIDRRTDIETARRSIAQRINGESSLFIVLRCFGTSFMLHDPSLWRLEVANAPQTAIRRQRIDAPVTRRSPGHADHRRRRHQHLRLAGDAADVCLLILPEEIRFQPLRQGL